MTRVIVSLSLQKTEAGGRTQPIPATTFGCPIFFEGIPALEGHGYDCRLLVAEHGRPITPGESIGEIALMLLSPDEVLPAVMPGAKFRLWEGKTIGTGTVLRLEKDR